MTTPDAIRQLVDEQAGDDPGRREAFLIGLVVEMARHVSPGHARACKRTWGRVKRTEDVD